MRRRTLLLLAILLENLALIAMVSLYFEIVGAGSISCAPSTCPTTLHLVPVAGSFIAAVLVGVFLSVFISIGFLEMAKRRGS